MNDVNELSQLTPQDRLQAYQLIIAGCQHLWSKNELQQQKVLAALTALIPLTKTDPYFLAHLNSYVMRQGLHKDLQVLTTYVNSLSSADGRPFSTDSKYMKPNLRYVSHAALQQLDPKLTTRVLKIANMKFSVDGYLNEGSHFPGSLRKAFEVYVKYREENIQMLKGIKKVGLGSTMELLYRALRVEPSDEAAAIIRYRQKNKKIKFNDSIYGFDKLDDLAIAEKIRADKLDVLGAVGALPRKVSPVIAVALLEQATGNQAVILKSIFENAGVLKDAEVMKLFEEKIATAKTALDRVETLGKAATEATQKALEAAKANVRKEQMGDIGKVFLHIDISYSMNQAIEVAKDRGAIIAEMVQNPQENFRWGTFNNYGRLLDLPEEFVKDAFAARLFGVRAEGGTDALACYGEARQFGADVDVIITDGGYNVGAAHNRPEQMAKRINDFHAAYPSYAKPKAAVIVHVVGGDFSDTVKLGYEAAGIPVAVIDPNTLTQSALVTQAVKSAVLGPVTIVDEIMNTELLSLPEYYFTV